MSHRPRRTGSRITRKPTARAATTAIVAINAVHRRIVVVRSRPIRILSSLKPYLIGIPLMIAIPAAGVLAGLRLAHSSRFGGSASALVDPIVAAGFFLLAAFFTGVRSFGLLATIWIATFVLLAIFLLGAWLIGSLVVAALRRDSTGGQHVYPLPLHQPPDEEPAAADGPMEAFLRS
jgi:hypothetical protein